MSVPADLLDETGRKEIVSFYSEVFGWQEVEMQTLDRKRLVLSAYRIDQFVFLIADDNPMTAPRLDHFGLGVGTMDELDTFYQRSLAFREKDDRVDIIDKKTDPYPGVSITSFYVRYLLPLMVEVQYFSFDGAGASGA
jgi:4-hydroxyphenylpyruvate dioxygenase-like putative hemolysin